MPSSKFVMPTGYEDEQRKAERKRKIAQIMLERGLQNNPNMQSWVQVLGQIAQTGAGVYLDKKADKIDKSVSDRMIADYATKNDAFDAMTKDPNVDPAAIDRRFGRDPMMQDRTKPYTDAMAAALKERGEHTNFGGQWRVKGGIPEGAFVPNKPTDTVVRSGPDGRTFMENTAATDSAAHRQGYGVTTAPNGQAFMPPPSSMVDPLAAPTLPPGPPPQGALPQAQTGSMDLNLLSPEERQIMQAELSRRAGGQGGGDYALQTDTTIPMGNPTTAIKPPAGVVNGKPYWLINGIPFDNPEGK